MFICSKLKMFGFGRLSEALQSAADVLAPPPSAFQDFQYHWKIIKQFYNVDRDLPRVHLSDTNIPYHLEQMLAILIEEETDEMPKGKLKNFECLDFILTNNLLDVFAELGIAETPPGARVNILNWMRRFLSCQENPPLEHASVFQPVQKLVQVCNGSSASPYEREEILFLVTVAGLVRKNLNLVHLFLPFHQHSAFVTSQIIRKSASNKIPVRNTLFESSRIETNIRKISIVHDEQSTPHEGDLCSSGKSEGFPVETVDEPNCSKFEFVCDCEEGERLYLLDAILSYLESPDSVVIVRACEGALILASLSSIDIKCSAVQTSFKALVYLVVEKVVRLCQNIPEDMDLGDIDEANVSWGLFPRDTDTEYFVGRYQLFEFLCWLDYCDCLARECPILHNFLKDKLRKELFEVYIEPGMLDIHAAFITVLAAKIIRQLRSNLFHDEIANWLVGEKVIVNMNGSDSLLSIIIENAQDNSDLIFQTLQFIEALLDSPHERILHGMVFFYVNTRGYFDVSAQRIQSWSDEEDEREKQRGSADGPIKSRTLAPHNILKIINSILLLLPRQIVGEGGGTCYEEYVQDASRHYQHWMNKTNKFNWPVEALFNDVQSPEKSSPSASLGLPSSTANCERSSKKDSMQCNDSGISEENFNEGPLLRLLFGHVKNMANQQYELNLAVIAILSKLALLPHPYLHEILLNPEIPVAPGATTLWMCMQVLAKQLLLEIPRIENFQHKITETGKRLLTNPPLISEGDDESDTLFESIIVLEEFCKELAAIAFVKYHHATE